jgi:aromatic-L-amino-acid decarboxylase
VSDEPDWELMAPVPFSLVCFRYAPSGMAEQERDRMNDEIMHAVNESGEVFLSHTKLNGRFTLRLSVGNIRTEERHVKKAWDKLRQVAGR